MKTNKLIMIATLLMISGSLFAGDKDALIKLDKQWGSTDGNGAEFLSKELIAIGTDGITGFKEQIAAAEEASQQNGTYTANDYKVKYLSKDIAVMVHSASGDNAHTSMHVYQKHGDKWIVVATASAPTASVPMEK